MPGTKTGYEPGKGKEAANGKPMAAYISCSIDCSGALIIEKFIFNTFKDLALTYFLLSACCWYGLGFIDFF
jgi:hypothetical protein